MKHKLKWLALGLASTLLVTACGATHYAEAKAPVTEESTSSNEEATLDDSLSVATTDDEIPLIFPLVEGEAPIVAISTTEDGPYPDPLRADVGIWDRTDDVWYMLDDVFPDEFTINRDHLYTVRLWLHSDGDVIKNIWVVAQLPNTEANPRSNCIRFVASDSETGQPLLSARVYMKADDDGGDLKIYPYITEDALNYDGTSLGDIGNEPVAIGFEFNVGGK